MKKINAETALKWCKSYLQGRSQFVINEEMSDSFDLDEGVPQVSVNGPLMLTLFSAPIGDVINAHGIKFMTYADHTQLYMLLHPSERDFVNPILELCLRDIKARTTRNRLVLNDSKTEVVHISSKFVKTPSFPKITFDLTEVEVSRVRVVMNLGFIYGHEWSCKECYQCSSLPTHLPYWTAASLSGQTFCIKAGTYICILAFRFIQCYLIRTSGQ